MRLGETPMRSIMSSSPLLAQSKPAPSAFSSFRIPGSGLHLTA